MQKLVVPILAIGLAGAMFVSPSAEAKDSAAAKRSRPCHKVAVAAMSKSAPEAPRDSEALFGSDFYNQHPSGGG